MAPPIKPKLLPESPSPSSRPAQSKSVSNSDDKALKVLIMLRTTVGDIIKMAEDMTPLAANLTDAMATLNSSAAKAIFTAWLTFRSTKASLQKADDELQAKIDGEDPVIQEVLVDKLDRHLGILNQADALHKRITLGVNPTSPPAHPTPPPVDPHDSESTTEDYEPPPPNLIHQADSESSSASQRRRLDDGTTREVEEFMERVMRKQEDQSRTDHPTGPNRKLC